MKIDFVDEKSSTRKDEDGFTREIYQESNISANPLFFTNVLRADHNDVVAIMI